MTTYHYQSLIESQNYEAALKSIFQYIEENPDTPEHYINAAILLQKFGKIEEAEVFLQKAITLDEESFAAMYTLANLYYDSSRFDEARILYLRAYAKNPNDSDINFMLAMCYVQMDQNKSALPFFETAYQQNTEDTEMLLQYGLACGHLGSYQQAENLFKQVNASKPSPDAHYNLGLIAMMQDDNQLAEVHFNAAIALQKDHYLALNGLKNLER